VIVDDLDLVGVRVPPFETDSPLVIDANTPLTFSVTFELLQSVGRWYAQVLERYRSVKHEQLPQCHPLNIRWEFASSLTVEEPFGFVIGPASNHQSDDTVDRY
jgi:hypothetical protein